MFTKEYFKTHPPFMGMLGRKGSAKQKKWARFHFIEMNKSKKNRKKMSILMKGRKITWASKISETKREKNKFRVYKTILPDRQRSSKEWRDWRVSVFKRDFYTCRWCNKAKSGQLEPHHIVKRTKDRDRTFDISNGITLCKTCHRKTFNKEEKYEQFFNSILNK